MSSGIFRTLGRCHTSEDLRLISAYRGSRYKFPAFSAEARDQWQASSVGNFSGQVSLELVFYVGLLASDFPYHFYLALLHLHSFIYHEGYLMLMYLNKAVD